MGTGSTALVEVVEEAVVRALVVVVVVVVVDVGLIGGEGTRMVGSLGGLEGAGRTGAWTEPPFCRPTSSFFNSSATDCVAGGDSCRWSDSSGTGAGTCRSGTLVGIAIETDCERRIGTAGRDALGSSATAASGVGGR